MEIQYLEVREIQKALEFYQGSAASFCQFQNCEHLGPISGLLLYVVFTDVMLFNVEPSRVFPYGLLAMLFQLFC